MLVGAAHIHFAEGERGPEEATLRFDDAVAFLEKCRIENLVATFHLRHPLDLRLATPKPLVKLVNEYDGNVHICLMREANLILINDPVSSCRIISHDIDAWHELNIDSATFEALLDGWILSAHFTSNLGWTNRRDNESAVEQTYHFMSNAYTEVMCQNWRGWVGHPYQSCRGGNVDEAIRRLLATAVDTARIVEIPIKPGLRKVHITRDIVHQDILLFRPELIAQFAPYSVDTKKPLVAISLDAHHLDDLQYGLENASKVAEWLIDEGVEPIQIWGWRD